MQAAAINSGRSIRKLPLSCTQNRFIFSPIGKRPEQTRLFATRPLTVSLSVWVSGGALQLKSHSGLHVSPQIRILTKSVTLRQDVELPFMGLVTDIQCKHRFEFELSKKWRT
ncbi:hypothetical protein CEXT_341551 [Caerostris extrusa]|uniref:Uncharacterized protein n=1 Tax=Caerostris extrusa TaxID=172846 RepID=A0AAV4SP36_CAEEX|nr:hypothetical protein CEXT_341551 [Caerostris extrusa]